MAYVVTSTPPSLPPRVISAFGLVVVGVSRQNQNQQGGGEGDAGGRWQNDMYDGQPQQQARHCSRYQRRCSRRTNPFLANVEPPPMYASVSREPLSTTVLYCRGSMLWWGCGRCEQYGVGSGV